jgi:hypothetical protein
MLRWLTAITEKCSEGGENVRTVNTRASHKEMTVTREGRRKHDVSTKSCHCIDYILQKNTTNNPEHCFNQHVQVKSDRKSSLCLSRSIRARSTSALTVPEVWLQQ